jgi:regulator of protease activity HflC (stomatin/prohibitin superfamily)
MDWFFLGFIFCCVVLYRLLRVVPTGTVLMVERFGQVTRVLTPGIRFLYPNENIKPVKWTFSGATPELRHALTETMVIDPKAWVIECIDGSIELDVTISVQLRDPVAACRTADPLRHIALRVLNNLGTVCSRRTCADCLRNIEGPLADAERIPNDLRKSIEEFGFTLAYITVESIAYTAATKRHAEQRIEHQIEMQKKQAELELETRRVAQLRELGVNIGGYIETLNLARLFKGVEAVPTLKL